MSASAPAPESIAAAIESVRSELREQVPSPIFEAFDGQAERLADRPFATAAPQPGDLAPDFTLPDASGREVSLSERLASGPIVLVFYRGAWCPYCNVQLRAYQAALPEFERRGARLVAVSPQLPAAGAELAEAAGLEFSVLSDLGANVAARYGLVFEVADADRAPFAQAGIEVAGSNADGSWHLPAPGTFVIAADRRVLHASVDGDFRRRAEVSSLLAALDRA